MKNITETVNAIFQSFVFAMMLLTRIPLPYCQLAASKTTSTQIYAQSTLWYPFVGVILAGILLALYTLLSLLALPAGIMAALLLSSWVYLTGALHLDGLADCADAACAAHRAPEKVLEIMKEPQCGSMAVVQLVLLLLIKFSALQSLVNHPEKLFIIILLALVLSRLAGLLLMLSTVYARKNGIAASLNPGIYRTPVIVMTMIILATGLLSVPATFFIPVVFSLALLLWWWRRRWIVLTGGYTGDCVGGLIELSEVVVLILAVVFL